MEVHDLHLDAIDFKEPPTKTQVVNTLEAMYKFLSKVGAAVVLDNNAAYQLGDQQIATLLGAAVQLRAAKDQFEGGSNSGLAVPQPQGPGGVPRIR